MSLCNWFRSRLHILSGRPRAAMIRVTDAEVAKLQAGIEDIKASNRMVTEQMHALQGVVDAGFRTSLERIDAIMEGRGNGPTS